MGTPDAALLDAIRAAPDDDGPRLVWADAVGGERGELVVVQCDLARGGLTPAEAGARRRRERALLARHGAMWASSPHVRHARFRRGFVDAVTVEAQVFATHASEILAAVPFLDTLRIDGIEGSIYEDDRANSEGDVTATRVEALLEVVRHYPSIDRLGFVSARFHWSDGDPYGRITRERYELQGRADVVAALLVSTGTLGRLRGLGLGGGGLTAAGAHTLVASRQLERMEALQLDDSELERSSVFALAHASPRLRSFTVDGGTLHAGTDLPLLEVLGLHARDADTLDVLASSPCGAVVRQLRLDEESPDHGLGALERLPRLEALTCTSRFSLPRRSPPTARLAELHLPALRELRIGQHLRAGALVEIARAFGEQLELLQVATDTEAATLSQLEALVAGDVIASELAPRYV